MDGGEPIKPMWAKILTRTAVAVTTDKDATTRAKLSSRYTPLTFIIKLALACALQAQHDSPYRPSGLGGNRE